jgi:hypothetical protein
MAPQPPPPLIKLSKTPIKVNPLAFGVCGMHVWSSNAGDELVFIYSWSYLELIKEWVTPSAMTTYWLTHCVY